jgi:hypothetical protein
MIISKRTGTFLQNISRAIVRRIEREGATCYKSETPDLLEHIRCIHIVIRAYGKDILTLKIDSKYARVIVWALIFIAILATHIVADLPGSEALSQALHEFLEIFLEQGSGAPGPEPGQMFI